MRPRPIAYTGMSSLRKTPIPHPAAAAGCVAHACANVTSAAHVGGNVASRRRGMPLRPCLVCGAPSPTPRCPQHTRAGWRGTAQTTRAKRERRPYTHAERTRRAQAVAQWRATYGDWCPGWQAPPHPTPDLTADHAHAVAAGGDEQGPLTVLCRSCNGRKQHKIL